MGWVVAGAIAVLVLGALMLVPVRLSLRLRQTGVQADAEVQVRLGILRLQRRIAVSELTSTALEHMWQRWRAKGEPVKPDLQETLRKVPQRPILRAVLPALRRLGRATRCRQFRLRIEVGGGDAMEVALLTGVVWSGAGMAVAAISRWVRLPSGAVAVAVVPNFVHAVWKTDLDCILTLRVGNAMMAIATLLRAVLRQREIIAWVRDSLRRKGDQRGGRPSDRRPHEDGHGKP